MLQYKWIFISRIINAAGSWFSFLAISIHLNSKFGSEYVVFNFLIQAIPSLLLAGKVGRLISERHLLKFYVGGNLIAALNLLPLFYSTSLTSILIFSIVNSTIATITNPTFSTLIGFWVRPHDLKEVHKILGALNACILAFAPPVGALVASHLGMKTLFAFDGISFVLAILAIRMVPEMILRSSTAANTMDRPNSTSMNAWSSALKHSFFLMGIFLMVGAIFNGIEFALFKKFEFTEQNIGNVFGAWGIGNILAVLFKFRFLERIPNVFHVFVFSFSFVLICFASNQWVSALLFIFAGFSSAELSGRLRSQIQLTITPGIAPLTVWSKVQLMTGIVNIVFYGLCAFMIRYSTFSSLTLLMALSSVFFIFAASQRLSKSLTSET